MPVSQVICSVFLCSPPPPSVLMARFTSGQMTTSSMPSRPIPKASPKARGPCVARILCTRGVLWRSDFLSFHREAVLTKGAIIPTSASCRLLPVRSVLENALRRAYTVHRMSEEPTQCSNPDCECENCMCDRCECTKGNPCDCR